MKVFKNVFFTVLLCVLSIFNAFAGNLEPPSPVAKRKPPPPPGLPIDENIFALLLIAVLFGIYLIYSFKLKQKTPM